MQLIPDHPSRFGGVLWLCLGVDDEHAELGRRVIVSGNRGRKLLLANCPVQSGGTTCGKDCRRDVEGRGIRIHRARSAPAENELALPNVTGEFAIPEASTLRLWWSGLPNWIARLHISIQLAYAEHRIARVDVA